MAQIREKIRREQQAQNLPSELDSPEETADSGEAGEDTFWEEHKKNIEFRFWDRHLLPINNLWKELTAKEQTESEETKIVKFELWHRFLTALNQKWPLIHIQNTLPPSTRPLVGRILDLLRLKVYSWLGPVFHAQQTFNSILVQFLNELVERITQMVERIVRLERNLALSGEAVKFYNELIRFLSEETTRIERNLDKQRALSGEAVKFYNELVRFLTEETTRIDRKVDQESFKLACESKRVDTLSSISSYCAFMEHRQEIMEAQIKELQSKVQELEKKLSS